MKWILIKKDKIKKETSIMKMFKMCIRDRQGIQQCRAVSCGKNKSVSVIPVGVCRVCFQLLCPQGICRRCRTKGQTGMTAFCLLDSLCRQKTQGVNCQVVHIIHLVFLQRFQFLLCCFKTILFLGYGFPVLQKSFDTDICQRVLCHLNQYVVGNLSLIHIFHALLGGI